MSVHISSIVWTLELTPTEKIVLLSMADQAHDDGQCYPSIANIMWRTGLSDRGVQRAIAKLVKRGYLRRKEAREGRSTIWQLPVQYLDDNKRKRVINNPRPTVTPDTSGTPERGSPLPRPTVVPPPTHGHPESLVESLLKQNLARTRANAVDKSTQVKSKPVKADPDWWKTEESTMKLAKQLGMYALGGESWHEFRGRIRAKLKEKD